MDWQVRATFVSLNNKTCRFEFIGTVTYAAGFFAHDFNILQEDGPLWIEPIINSGTDITFIVRRVRQNYGSANFGL